MNQPNNTYVLYARWKQSNVKKSEEQQKIGKIMYVFARVYACVCVCGLLLLKSIICRFGKDLNREHIT